jgi:hypothetical protein
MSKDTSPQDHTMECVTDIIPEIQVGSKTALPAAAPDDNIPRILTAHLYSSIRKLDHTPEP